MTIVTENQNKMDIAFKLQPRGEIQFWRGIYKDEQFPKPTKTYFGTVNSTTSFSSGKNSFIDFRLSFPRSNKTREVFIPDLKGISSSNPQITPIIRDLIRTFWAIVLSKAFQSSFPIEKTEVATFKDPSEERIQVVLRLYTQANASQSVAFWDSLEKDIQEWLPSLPERKKLIFTRDISLRIHWK
jgi:hypothetical protein